MQTEDPYAILGVSPGAAPDEIRRAFYAKAKQYHPDVNPGSSWAEFNARQVNAAYARLKEKRRQMFGEQAPRPRAKFDIQAYRAAPPEPQPIDRALWQRVTTRAILIIGGIGVGAILFA